MKNVFVGLLVLSSLGVSANEFAKADISAAVQKTTPFKVVDVENSPMDGFYQVITETGVIYASKDGKHLFSGNLHQLTAGLPNLTKQRNQKIYQGKIKALYNDFITYRAPEQKHEVIVFYDNNCGYCHKMHSEIAEYNAQGITVHYAAWPRDGLVSRDGSGKSPGHTVLENIWCSDNKNLAFNMASRRAEVSTKTCNTSIAQQFELGNLLGVRGTPAVYSLNGEVVAEGYAKAPSLKMRLEGMAP